MGFHARFGKYIFVGFLLMKIVVVGGGMQGLVIARNIAARPEKPQVVIADLKAPEKLPAGVTFTKMNVLEQAQIDPVVKDADAIVLAVPSAIAREALANLIKAGKPVADVSFTADPPLDLSDHAKQTGACCVVDCGIAPGLSHVLVGSAHSELGSLDSVRILVGGMPQNPPKGFHHAVYFNPHDLVAEYVRPARARKKSENIAPAPMDCHFEEFEDEELGKLEAFLSDGLRSLLDSFPGVPDMAELTLRWKGHLDTMRTLHHMGLLDDEHAHVVAKSVGAKFPAHAYPDVLLMVVEARKGNDLRRWRLIDRRVGDESAMSRTTGYTTAATAMLLARGLFKEPGVHAPERLGASKALVDEMLSDLKERGIAITELPQPVRS